MSLNYVEEMKGLKFVTLIILILANSCKNNDDLETGSDAVLFGQPQKVTVQGYSSDIMEPFLSWDGNTLFFNNLNNPAVVNTNLQYATRINDSLFDYQGELKGVNTEYLEGVATMDDSNEFYFISTRSYAQTFSTIYKGSFSEDSVSNVQLVQGLSKHEAGWVDFDVAVSSNGNYLFFAEGLYDSNGGPYEADLIIAEKVNGSFQRKEDQSVLANVNSDALEYAACISPDMLDLYFNRVDTPLTVASVPRIYIATRNSVNEPFNKPYRIDAITGFTEAPTVSPDNRIVYYHKRENGIFVLYMVRRN